MKSAITTHILDVNLGRPATNVAVVLYRLDGSDFIKVTEGITNEDGRILDWMGDAERQAGTYKVVFDTDGYFNTL